MKKYTVVSAFLLAAKTLSAQVYWQQEVNYNIRVSLNDTAHTLKGFITIEYINNSPDKLDFIWMHLWPNAYKNKNTALFRQIASNNTRSSKMKRFTGWGYIDSLDFKVDSKAVIIEPDPVNIDIVKLLLPAPLAPGERISISTPFFTKLPDYFSRMGHTGNYYYMIAQWYPKPAVYDRKGWHPIPYLDLGEFYSEFGSFDVSITLPCSYVVAATGNLQTANELEAYKSSGTANRRMLDSVIAENKRPNSLETAINRLDMQLPATIYNTGSKTLHFTETQVHDFAWFACKDLLIQYDTLKVDGNTIDVFAFHHPESGVTWYNSSHFVKEAVKYYSAAAGAYPYKTVKAVEGPENEYSGGMEYPTVTMITKPGATQEGLDGLITHEVGHNWFYGILASNEREHPWMDEGINTYYEFKYEAEKYRTNPIFGGNVPPYLNNLEADGVLLEVYKLINNMVPIDTPVETPADKFTSKEDYAATVYLKTALWLYIIELSTSKQELNNVMRAYYHQWKFKHPYPEDFLDVIEKLIPGKSTEQLLKMLYKKGPLL
jgi:Peptidase family M1 domain